MGIELKTGIPQGEFAENVDVPLVGLGMTYLRQVGYTPLSFGVGASALIYGFDCWESTRGVGPEQIETEYTLSSSVLDLNARMRLQPRVPFAIQPYGEAFAGGSMLNTQLTVEDLDQPDCDAVLYEETLSRDFSLAYGAGVGLLIPIQGYYLDLGATYRNSGQASYMNGDADRVFTSRTDMWLFHIGISLDSF